MNNANLITNRNFLSNFPAIHDAICEKWIFDYCKKELTLFYTTVEGEQRKMSYHDVYAHQMVSCDLWGSSPHIYGCKAVEKQSGVLYNRLLQTITGENCDESLIRRLTDSIEIEIQFISGDVLHVLCKSISAE